MIPFPNKKYNIIYADPPWQQKAGRPIGGYKTENGKQIWNVKSEQSQNLPYPTMTIKQISDLPVEKITADNAVLFIWVTNKYLPNVFDIIRSWGFVYSTALTWCKKPFGGGMGGTFRISSEYLIYCRKGSLKVLSHVNGTWFDIKRPYKNGYPNHSAKPPFFRDLISRLFIGDKIELFARQKTAGWDVWGNEISNDESKLFKPITKDPEQITMF